jgi:hypothetical protein
VPVPVGVEAKLANVAENLDILLSLSSSCQERQQRPQPPHHSLYLLSRSTGSSMVWFQQTQDTAPCFFCSFYTSRHAGQLLDQPLFILLYPVQHSYVLNIYIYIYIYIFVSISIGTLFIQYSQLPPLIVVYYLQPYVIPSVNYQSPN